MKSFGPPKKFIFHATQLWSRYATKSTHIFEYVIINIKETKNIKGILVLKTMREFLSL